MSLSLKTPNYKEYFAFQSFMFVINNEDINVVPGDESKLVIAHNWKDFDNRIVEIVEPSISKHQGYISLNSMGSISLNKIKLVPEHSMEKSGYESSWLRYLGREYKKIANLLKQNIVIYGTKLPAQIIKEFGESSTKS